MNNVVTTAKTIAEQQGPVYSVLQSGMASWTNWRKRHRKMKVIYKPIYKHLMVGLMLLFTLILGMKYTQLISVEYKMWDSSETPTLKFEADCSTSSVIGLIIINQSNPLSIQQDSNN